MMKLLSILFLFIIASCNTSKPPENKKSYTYEWHSSKPYIDSIAGSGTFNFPRHLVNFSGVDSIITIGDTTYIK